MMEPSANFGGVVGFGILSALFVYFAKRQKFFEYTPFNWNHSIYLWTPVLFFILYFASSLIVIRLLAPWVLLHIRPTLSFCVLTSSIPFSQMFLYLAILSCLPSQIRIKMWKDPIDPSSFLSDLKSALIAWLISFGILSFIGNFLQLFLYYVFNITHIPDQAAVAFVKRSLKDPACFPLLLSTIAIATPIVEEILFRGCLQSFIRKHLGSKSAIWLTALCFTFFHYSPEQKIGNLVVIGSLFPLALLLSYLYEKQRSLRSPILLHAIFNGGNLFALLFFGETPCGPV